MSLWRYIARRLLLQIFVLIGVSALTFFLMFIVPGDPATLLAEYTGTFDAAAIQEFKTRWGFDKPVYRQYLIYMSNLLHGDFGIALVTRRPILREMVRFFLATVELSIVAFLMALVMGIAGGIASAIHRNGPLDHIVRIVSLFGVSMPIFWLAIILLIVFYYHLGWVPSSQRIAITMATPQHKTGLYTIDTLLAGDLRGFVTVLRHLLLPAFVLAFSIVGLLARVMRASMLEVLGEDYVRTAHAKGLSAKAVLFRHVLRNALIPTVTVLGLAVGGLLSGAVLTETVFAWPGLGRFIVQSIFALDRAAVVGTALLITVVYSSVNLAVDVLVALLDPRIRYD
jgi:peptide/nickel transport system permease protein